MDLNAKRKMSNGFKRQIETMKALNVKSKHGFERQNENRIMALNAKLKMDNNSERQNENNGSERQTKKAALNAKGKM